MRCIWLLQHGQIFLVIGKVILGALAWQVCRQGPASTFLAFRLFGLRQSRVRQINAIRLVAALVVPFTSRLR